MAFKGRPSVRPTILSFGDTPSEPQAPPTCPKELDAAGKKKWRELVKEMVGFGSLMKIDRDLMRLYCEAHSQYESAMDCMKKSGGPILKSKTTGGMFRNPFMEVANHASREMQRLSKLLGLDKHSQKRLGITPKVAKSGVKTRDRSAGPPPPAARDA
jgi:P27 family predicted phage terminase small subunit